KYKSIYDKKTGHLKVIEFGHGQIINEVIGEESATTSKEESRNSEEKLESLENDEYTSIKEYETLDKQINVQDYEIKVAEDNQNKRVLLFVDKDGQKQYKSIFVKKKNRLKIIDLNKGQIFNE